MLISATLNVLVIRLVQRFERLMEIALYNIYIYIYIYIYEHMFYELI